MRNQATDKPKTVWCDWNWIDTVRRADMHSIDVASNVLPLQNGRSVTVPLDKLNPKKYVMVIRVHLWQLDVCAKSWHDLLSHPAASRYQFYVCYGLDADKLFTQYSPDILAVHRNGIEYLFCFIFICNDEESDLELSYTRNESEGICVRHCLRRHSIRSRINVKTLISTLCKLHCD